MRFVPHHHERLAKRIAPEARFWPKVDKRGPDECWEWTGARLPTGYGVFQRGDKVVNAHRFSYELANGAPPASLHVLHSCDNPPCVNPAHLRLGTRAENMNDMKVKGRASGARGERHRSSKLTETQVRHMRRTYTGAKGEQTALANRYGVTIATIEAAISGRTWRHI